MFMVKHEKGASTTTQKGAVLVIAKGKIMLVTIQILQKQL